MANLHERQIDIVACMESNRERLQAVIDQIKLELNESINRGFYEVAKDLLNEIEKVDQLQNDVEAAYIASGLIPASIEASRDGIANHVVDKSLSEEVVSKAIEPLATPTSDSSDSAEPVLDPSPILQVEEGDKSDPQIDPVLASEASFDHSKQEEPEALIEPDSPIRKKKKRSKESNVRIITSDEFFSKSRAYTESDTRPHILAKQIICLGRAVIESNPEIEDTVWDEVEFVAKYLKEPFGGMEKRVSLSSEDWMNLAQGYEYLHEADQVLASIKDVELSDKDRSELMHLIALAETVINDLSVSSEKFKPFRFDSDQIRIHQILMQYRDDHHDYIPAWNQTVWPKQFKSRRSYLLDGASKLARTSETKLKGLAKKVATEKAMATLDSLLRSTASEDFTCELAHCVVACLSAGVSATNKVLSETLKPYLDTLKEYKDLHPQLGALIRATEKKVNLDRVKHNAASASLEGDADPILPDDFLEVCNFLKGKVILMVGGNMQPYRIKMYKEAFGVQDVIWPSNDQKSSQLDQFTKYFDKVDVVMRLVRFSRTAHKDIIPMAKEAGKIAVHVRGGLGVNQIAHDILEQVIGKETKVSVV